MADLEVVGRHALLFDDDANAAFVNSDEALVDWNSLLIDRYDVRHLLSGPPPPRTRRRQLVPAADASIAAELDRERFLDLLSDRKEQDVHDDDGETVTVTGYRAVGFSYGNPNEAIDEKKNNDAESVYYPPFPVPGSLTQNLPPNEKLHQIIARTATFVHNHGGQSEIVLRVKQGDNPTFGFLMPGHHLHPYFRFLVDHQELLQYDANAKQEKPGNNISNQTGGALSLLGSVYGDEDDEDGGTMEDLPETKINKPREIVDTISTTVSHKSDSSGHTIMKNGTLSNKEKLHAVKRNSSVINSVKRVAESVVKKDEDASGSSGNKTRRPDMPPSIPDVKRPVVEPPSELKRVVEKIVEFILRNGREFEAVLAEQDRKFGRFPFLLQSNLYHPYYLQVLQETQESKSSSKSSVSEKHEPRREKKTSRSSSRTAEKDIPDEYDKKEKFKMVLGKSKKDEQEPPPKIKQEPPSEIDIDAEVAAAILKAATRGIKDPSLELFPKLSRTNVEEQSNNHVSQSRSFIRKDTILESSVSPPVANATVETAKADSSEALLTYEQKLKAERLKRAKMFAARVKNGADPLKPESLRSLSVEPPISGVSSSVTDVVNPKGGKEREGSLVGVDVDDLEKIEKVGKKSLVGESDDRRTKWSYRSWSRKDDDEEEDDDDNEEDKYSRKKCGSHRSSRHGEDRHRHRKSSFSSKHDDEKYSDDDDYRSTRKRQKYRNSDDDDEEHRRHSRRRCKHDGSSDNEDRHRRRADKKTEHWPEKEAELEEGEISAKSDQSIACEKGRVSREASVDLPKPCQGISPSRPLESMEVPDDLRAKIRAMLMATM